MKKTVFLLVLGCLVLSLAGVPLTPAKEVPRMSKEQLREKMGGADVTVTDVRTGKDWKASELKIKGAVRRDPGKVAQWASLMDKVKSYVLYCA